MTYPTIRPAPRLPRQRPYDEALDLDRRIRQVEDRMADTCPVLDPDTFAALDRNWDTLNTRLTEIRTFELSDEETFTLDRVMSDRDRENR